MSAKGKRASAAPAAVGASKSSAAAAAEKPQVSNPPPPAAPAADSKADAAKPKPKPIDWYAKFLNKKKNYIENIKFDAKHPMDAAKNAIRLTYSSYNEEKTGTVKQTATVEWNGKENTPDFYGEPGGGELPANILTCLFTLGSTHIAPYGNYRGTNPLETNAKFTEVDIDKIAINMMADGYAPHVEWMDPTDTKKVKRDKNFLRMKKKGEELMEWAVRYILMDPMIVTKFKVDAKGRFPNDLDAQVGYVLGQANGVCTKKKDTKAKKRAELAATTAVEKSTVAMTTFLEEDSERIFFNRNLIPKLDTKKVAAESKDEEKKKPEKSKSNGISVKTDPFEIMVQQKGRHVWKLNVFKVKLSETGKVVTELDLNHPFKTANKDSKTGKWKPLTESELKLRDNTLAMCDFKLCFYLDGQNGLPMGARRIPNNLTTFGMATNFRPKFGAKPAVSAEDEKAMNEDAEIIEAMKEAARQEQELLKDAQGEAPVKTAEEEEADEALKKAQEEAGEGPTEEEDKAPMEDEADPAEEGPPSPTTIRLMKQLEAKKAAAALKRKAAAAPVKEDTTPTEEKVPAAPPKVRTTHVESVSAKELEESETGSAEPAKKRLKPAVEEDPIPPPPPTRVRKPAAAAPEEDPAPTPVVPHRIRKVPTAAAAAASDDTPDEPTPVPPPRARAVAAAAAVSPSKAPSKAPTAAGGGKAVRKAKPSDMSREELSGF